MESLVMQNLFGGIYKNSKVLITGHTGFKGSWLALWLSLMKAEVLGYALEPETHPNHFSLLSMPIESVLGNILDKDYLFDSFKRFQPEIVFHLAAQPLVRRSYTKPVETFQTNVMGTVNVFEACRQSDSVKAIINITSDKCYENNEWVWGYRERDPLGGHDPYSASKGCAELVTTAYRNSFFHPDKFLKSHHLLLASARAGNVIGGGDWADDRLVPDIMRAASRGEKVIIRNPEGIRPWQHVLESLSGYLFLGMKLLSGDKTFAQPWNFGPRDESLLTVAEVTDSIKRTWDKVNYSIAPENDYHPHESNMLKLDCSKANSKLGWKGIWDQHTTLERTVRWYRQFYEDQKITSVEDLEKYVEDAQNIRAGWA